MTDRPPPPPPGWEPPPGPTWGPPVWGPPPAQPWPPPWAPPPPPPPRRTPVGLIVGLCIAAVVVVLGGMVLLVTLLGSRVGQAPVARVDHWHAAYGVYVCDRYLGSVERSGDQNGIHTHGDGIVHVEPLGRSSAGRNAVFLRFEEALDLEITSSSLRWVDGLVPVDANVSGGCGGRKAEVASFVDGARVGGAPGRIRLRDGQVIVIALMAKGTSYARLGPPPSEAYLPRLRGRVP